MNTEVGMRIKTIQKSSTKQAGFSLIELMIAMTLGLLLMTGVVQIFLSSKQAYTTISGSSETLDNGFTLFLVQWVKLVIGVMFMR